MTGYIQQCWSNKVASHAGALHNDPPSREINARRKTASSHDDFDDTSVVCIGYQVAFLGGQSGVYSFRSA
jgi:hypothetical protein